MHSGLLLRERIYYTLRGFVGLVLLVILGRRESWRPDVLLFVFVFATIVLVAHFKRFELVLIERRRGASYTRYVLDDVPIFAAIFLKGTAVTAWIMALGAFIFQVYLLCHAIFKLKIRRLEWEKVLFGFSDPFARVLMIVPASASYERINGQDALLGSWRNVLAVVACAIIYFAVASILSSLTQVLREGKAFRDLPEVMEKNYAQIYLHLFMLTPLGVNMALLFQHEILAVVLLLLPVIMMHRAIQACMSIMREAQLLIQTLARTLDERDHYTFGHSERVAQYAHATARILNLPEFVVEEVETAGRIHDLGKIAIPDAVLQKPDRLDSDEYMIMKRHTSTTLELFEGMRNLTRQIPVKIAALHHERFDGSGYGSGKKGEEIPIGARILAVADAFDAMTSDRPYRKSIPQEEAIRRIREGSGTQFDPVVVEAFINACREGIVQRIAERWKTEGGASLIEESEKRRMKEVIRSHTFRDLIV